MRRSPGRRVSVAAQELAGGRIALQAMLASHLPWPAELLSVRLALQPGFMERASALALDDLLPMQARCTSLTYPTNALHPLWPAGLPRVAVNVQEQCASYNAAQQAGLSACTTPFE